MNDVFPKVQTVLLAEAPAGSILRIPRSKGPIYALVTDQIVDDIKSVVMLNAQFPNYPNVIFAQKWRLDEPYLCYRTNIRFELSLDEQTIDDYGHDWWRTPGIIVCVGEQLLVRAGATEFGFGNTHVNIRTGAVFSGNMPNNAFSFGTWRLVLQDDKTKSIFELCSSKISKNK